MARDLDTPLSEMDRSSRRKMNKNTIEFLIFNQLDVMDIYRLLYPSTRHVFFASVHDTFTKTGDNLDH